MGALISTGISAVWTGDDSGTITAQLLDIEKDPDKADQVDVTYQGTSGVHRDFLSGLVDGQSITLNLHFDTDNVRPVAGEAGDLVVTFTNTGITLNTLTIPANVEEVGAISGGLGDKMTEAVKFKVTAIPVWSTVS